MKTKHTFFIGFSLLFFQYTSETKLHLSNADNPDKYLSSDMCSVGEKVLGQRLDSASSLKLNELYKFYNSQSLEDVLYYDSNRDEQFKKTFSVYRMMAFSSLINKCGLCGQQFSSVRVIEFLNKGYCYSYTMYIIDEKGFGMGYQIICSNSKCKRLEIKLPDFELNELFDKDYNKVYVESCFKGNFFYTNRINFTKSSKIHEEIF